MGVDEQEFNRLLQEKKSKERDAKLVDVMMKIFAKVSSIDNKITNEKEEINVDVSGIEAAINRIKLQPESSIPPSVESIFNAMLKKLDNIAKKPKELKVIRDRNGLITTVKPIY